MKIRLIYFLLMAAVLISLLLKLNETDESQRSFISKITSFATKTKSISSNKTPIINLTADEITGLKKDVHVSSAFTKWFEDEARALEKSSEDSNQKEADLLIAGEKMTPGEIQFLKAAAVDMHAPANNRIFATYMLTLVPNLTAGALLEVVRMPLVMQGDQQVHSPEETLAAQEKSLRRMAIDALIKRAHKDETFMDEVRSAIDQIGDPSLRSYVEKKLKTGK